MMVHLPCGEVAPARFFLLSRTRPRRPVLEYVYGAKLPRECPSFHSQ